MILQNNWEIHWEIVWEVLPRFPIRPSSEASALALLVLRWAPQRPAVFAWLCT